MNGTLGTFIVIDGVAVVGHFADGRPIELRIAERALGAGIVGLEGSTAVHVVEGATNVSCELGGKSTEEILADPNPPTVPKLADGTSNVSTPAGTLTAAT